MPLHLIKLCVGVDSLDGLRARMAMRRGDITHRTRMVPRRLTEPGASSLYWVIRGHVQARQRLLAIRPFVDEDGIGRCHLVLDPAVVATEWYPRRAFQGWRYLPGHEAPPDFGEGSALDLPPKLKAELAELGLV